MPGINFGQPIAVAGILRKAHLYRGSMRHSLHAVWILQCCIGLKFEAGFAHVPHRHPFYRDAGAPGRAQCRARQHLTDSGAE